MDDIFRLKLLSSLSSQGIPADAVAGFVNALESLEPMAKAEMTGMLLASPKLGKDLWEAAHLKVKALQGGMGAEEAVEKEIKLFQAALAELE
jgi:hypothetical protein